MSTRARIAALGGAAAVLEAGLGVAALVAFGPAEIAFYALACAVATVLVTVGLWRLLGMSAPGDDGDGGAGIGGDDGGGPDGAGGPHEPSWWPAFERDFRAHARERERCATGGSPRSARSPRSWDATDRQGEGGAAWRRSASGRTPNVLPTSAGASTIAAWTCGGRGSCSRPTATASRPT